MGSVTIGDICQGVWKQKYLKNQQQTFSGSNCSDCIDTILAGNNSAPETPSIAFSNDLADWDSHPDFYLFVQKNSFVLLLI